MNVYKIFKKKLLFEKYFIIIFIIEYLYWCVI